MLDSLVLNYVFFNEVLFMLSNFSFIFILYNYILKILLRENGCVFDTDFGPLR